MSVPFPPSPASSMKACYVRSRPTSPISECPYDAYTGFSALTAAFSESDEDVAATARWAQQLQQSRSIAEAFLGTTVVNNTVKSHIDARSGVIGGSGTSTTTRTAGRVRIVRRSDAEVLPDSDQRATVQTPAGPSRTPSYRSIISNISSVLLYRRKTYSGRSGTHADSQNRLEDPREPEAALTLKPSSASLFTRRHRRTRRGTYPPAAAVPSAPPPTPMHLSRSDALLLHAHSFSAFGYSAPNQDDDDELDDVTKEARGVVERIRQKWVFEDVHLEAIFERDVQ